MLANALAVTHRAANVSVLNMISVFLVQMDMCFLKVLPNVFYVKLVVQAASITFSNVQPVQEVIY